VVPSIVAVAGLLFVSVLRLRRFFRVLTREERVLRGVEVLGLALLLMALLSFAIYVWEARLAEAGREGKVAGLLLCLLAVLRGRLCCWESRRGPLSERLFEEVAVPAAIAPPGEVQISLSSNTVAGELLA